MTLMEWLLSVGKSESSVERKTEVETRTLEHHFTVYDATITFPDGDTEQVSYTNGDYGDDVIKIFDHDADDYSAYRSPGYSRDYFNLEPSYENPRRFSMSNIRDMDITDEREMIATAEVEIDVQYKRHSENDEWHKAGSMSLQSGSDDPDVTIWLKCEYEQLEE